ncbi:DEAD/DEAH box helicase [uncultured Salinicola sp.]|uniref:DEAD/DEAH box helicase n=1 Tax=uncultured Salinicola sp. TaxID=1193542 RepID=UPI0026145A30|nr:DEAD/DEAH box helicase [uncultured Salinicola sp.]
MQELSTTIRYGHDGASTKTDFRGMRAMQAKAYAKRDEQYLLIKSPPASGKSRALMFLAIDKLKHQGISKVIIAVPEKSIGASFGQTDLATGGFEEDWNVAVRNDLCAISGDDSNKVGRLKDFIDSDPGSDISNRVIICTHATLRHAWSAMSKDIDGNSIASPYSEGSEWKESLEGCLIAIDEFHHGSADEESKLGGLVRDVVSNGRTHMVAMTGSYFRGDRIPVMRPEDEARFTHVTYTYYEQLSGYEHLKTLGLDYRFYSGHWLDAIGGLLDTTKKTIVHIPSVRSATAGDIDKLEAVNDVIGKIGKNKAELQEAGSPYIVVETPDGRILRIADLVTESSQANTLAALRSVKGKDDVDFIIALGMAKEGFDWIWCEHAVTVGVRGSMTEVVQIIGRTTRDAPGKTHAQFTNLISEPDEALSSVREQVNDHLKAIASSLLMEQVMAPNLNFRTRPGTDTPEGEATSPGIDMTKIEPAEHNPIGIARVTNLSRPTSPAGLAALDKMDDIQRLIILDERVQMGAFNPGSLPDNYVPDVIVPDIIAKNFPDVPEEDIPALTDHALVDMTARQRIMAEARQAGLDLEGGSDSRTRAEEEHSERQAKATSKTLVDLSRNLDIGEIDINLIRSVDPWRDSYRILSKQLDEGMLKQIKSHFSVRRQSMTEEEANAWVEDIKRFHTENSREPDVDAESPRERNMAIALRIIRNKKAQLANERKAQDSAQGRADADVASGITD